MDNWTAMHHPGISYLNGDADDADGGGGDCISSGKEISF